MTPSQGTAQVIEALVKPDQAGARLDRALADLVVDLSRSRLQSLIRTGAITLQGETISDPGRRVKPGETYRIAVPEPEPATPSAEAIALTIVYEDDAIVVIDKPAGLVVHPAAGHASGTLVNALIAHCGDSLSGIGGVRRPGIVHRLDKDTSGLLVVAKTDAAHQGLASQFQSHGADGRLERRYRAVVWGVLPRRRGMVDAPLGRSRTHRTRIAVTSGDEGRRAITHYEVLEVFAGADGKPVASLIELRLETGRTHQIRVHMAHLGHPVMGDPVYASGFRTSASRLPADAQACLARLDRQALHAAILAIEHPIDGRRLVFESPLPQDLADLLGSMRTSSIPRKRPAGVRKAPATELPGRKR
ncbi:MAG: RluA family pseudouridine synthase [Hyphomicrobiaceae bacterium]|nr:RluA family pseudouridine synthase [Hyphomicrobiaceae bacterium]